ncbi:hypothetical protein ALP30_04471, partial [Pseudomonas syringae pv. primulae]
MCDAERHELYYHAEWERENTVHRMHRFQGRFAAAVTSESSRARQAEACHHPPLQTPLESPISAFCKNVPQTARILANTAGHTLMRAFPSPESDQGRPMKKILTAYIGTLLAFLILDGLWLGVLMGPTYREWLGPLMLATPVLGP